MATPSIFISYRIADTQTEARLLYTDLANHFGPEAVFLDKKRLDAGMDWPDELEKNVQQAKVILVLIKDEAKWLGVKRLGGRRMDEPGDWVRLEIEKALADPQKTVVPILVDGASIPPAADLPDVLHGLHRKQGKKFATEKWDSDLAALVADLEKIGLQKPAIDFVGNIDPLDELPLPATVPNPGDHHEAPYLGLPFFDRTAARLFFGRTREILDFFKLVQDPQTPLVCLFGHSGVGKSSLLAAGVRPRLEAAHSPFYERRQITEKHGLAGQLARLRDEPKTPGKPPVYILDQVEEMFTNPLLGEPTAFAESLRELRETEPEATVVLGFRSDFHLDVSNLLEKANCSPADLPLLPLGQTALVEAIEGAWRDPALQKRYRLDLEKGFAEYVARKLLHDESGSGAAAFLQNRLLKLYNAARARRTASDPAVRLTIADYDELARNSAAEAELLDFQLQRLRDDHRVTADERTLLATLAQFVVDKPTAGTLPPNQLPDDPDGLRLALRRVSLLTELDSRAVRLSHDLLAPVIRQRYQEFLVNETERVEMENIRLHLRDTRKLLGNIEFEAAFEEFTMTRSSRILLPKEVGEMAFELAYVFLWADKRERGAEALLHYITQMSATDKLLPVSPDQTFPDDPDCPTLLDFLRRCDPAFFKRLEKRYFPTMLRVEGGSFDMGDVLDDNERDNEKPVHRVTLSTFELAETPLTWWQYGIFCLETGREIPSDSGMGRAERPVFNVSWDDATTFADWLSRKTPGNTDSERYRLPTEAEWEYAARERGKPVRFGNGKMVADPAEMNFNGDEKYQKPYSVAGEYRGKTTPVRQFPANALGFYDLSGNVWEWCGDWYDAMYYEQLRSSVAVNPQGAASGESRVLRGGSWDYAPNDCRAAYRGYLTPSFRDDNIGFRLARAVTL